MTKIDLIIESIRDEYMINLLEEGEVSELEALKTKKFLNESLGRIRGMLVEEGALDAVKNHLANNWGKYLAGGAAGGALANGAQRMGMNLEDYMNAVQQIYNNEGLGTAAGVAVGIPPALAGIGAMNAGKQADQLAGEAKEGLQAFGDKLVDAAGNIYDQAGNLLGNLKDFAAEAGEKVADVASEAGEGISNLASQAGEALQNVVQ